MNRNSNLGFFGRKEEPKPSEKPPERPASNMFSGMMMKKTVKAEAPSSAYSPPIAEVNSFKPAELSTHKSPDLESLAKSKPTIETQESETLKASLDPFADLKLNEASSYKKPTVDRVEETNNKNLEIKSLDKNDKAEKVDIKKNCIPGFADSDDEDNSFQFVKKSKLNILQNEGVKNVRLEASENLEGKKEEIRIDLRKEEIRIDLRKEESKIETKKEEAHEENKSRGENRILKMLEEKKKKDLEEKERKEREIIEEKSRQERLKVLLEEEKKRKLEEERKKQEEEKRKLLKSINPVILKETIEENLKSFDKTIQEKVAKQSELKDKNSELVIKIQQYQLTCSEFEIKEDQAAYEEDFEEAARIHEELESLRDQIKSMHNTIQEHSALYSSLEAEKSLVMLSKKEWMQETYSTRNQLLIEIKASLENDKIAAESKRNLKLDELNEKNLEVYQKKEELVSLKNSVLEKKTELDLRILEKTEDLKNNHLSLSSEYSSLLQEIEELEKLLKTKKAKASELAVEVKKADTELRKSLIEFEEEVKETDEAVSVVNRDIEKLDNEKSALDHEELLSKQELDAFIEKFDEKTIDNNQVQNLLNKLTEELEKISILNTTREQFLQEIENTQSQLLDKEKLMKDALEYSQSCKEEIQVIKETIKNQEERAKDIDKKIPLLENEKKLAAAAKQFKVKTIQDASRFNNEIKDLNGEYLKVKENIQTLLLQLKAKEEDLQIVRIM